jgi:hypothetical protein
VTVGWFKRDRGAAAAEAAAGHEAPIEIDLGMRREFEVEMEVERLKSAGLSVYLFAQREVPEFGSGLGPSHCRVYVQRSDEPRVRAELAARGFL